ncbi:MAG: AEC family transporter [Elusimicrobiota bacterium]
MDLVFNLVLKIIPYILVGWLLSRLKIRSIETFIKYFVSFALYILIPLFIFFAMWSAPLKQNLNNTKNIGMIAVIVVLFGIFFAVVYSKIFYTDFRDTALPIIFMNSAYLAIPVNTVFFGTTATFYAIIYNITISILHFTIGLWIVSGSGKEIFRLPILYFAFLGILLNLTDVKIPLQLTGFSKMLTSVTLPVMLCLVGYQIKMLDYNMLKRTLVGVSLRMLGGVVVAFVFCKIFDITGITRSVCLISSSMPSAVNTYIFSKEYNADFSFASSMIVVGLIFSVILIPLILWLL